MNYNVKMSISRTVIGEKVRINRKERFAELWLWQIQEKADKKMSQFEVKEVKLPGQEKECELNEC